MDRLFKHCFLLIFIISISDVISAQTTFIKTYDDSLYFEFGNCVISVQDGGYLICGEHHYNLNEYDIGPVVLKTDEFGNAEWEIRDIFPEQREVAEKSIEIQNGIYLVVGNYWGGQMFAACIDSAGSIIWQNEYGDEWPYYTFYIMATDDGNYIFCGSEMWLVGMAKKSNWDSTHATIIKIDPDGNVIWDRVFTVKGELGVMSIAADTDGGYLVVGSLDVELNGQHELFAMKINEMGDSLWYRQYADTVWWWKKEIVKTEDDEFLILTKYQRAMNKLSLIKMNSSGEIVSRQDSNDENSYGAGFSIHGSHDGNYLICGTRNDNSFLRKIDNDENILWEKDYYENYSCSSIDLTFDDGYIICGNRWQNYSSFFDEDIFLMKVDNLGNITHTPSTIPLKIQNFKLGQNYPNPFNSLTKIEYDISAAEAIKLTIFNIKAECIRTLIDEKQEKGSHYATWDGCDFSGQKAASGVYFYKLETGSGKFEVKKMVFQK